jgi:hypothetical protein
MRSLMLTTCFGFALAAVLGLATARAEPPLQSEGKCWMNTTNGNYGWENCKPEPQTKKVKKEVHHSKGEGGKPGT